MTQSEINNYEVINRSNITKIKNRKNNNFSLEIDNIKGYVCSFQSLNYITVITGKKGQLLATSISIRSKSIKCRTVLETEHVYSNGLNHFCIEGNYIVEFSEKGKKIITKLSSFYHDYKIKSVSKGRLCLLVCKDYSERICLVKLNLNKETLFEYDSGNQQLTNSFYDNNVRVFTHPVGVVATRLSSDRLEIYILGKEVSGSITSESFPNMDNKINLSDFHVLNSPTTIMLSLSEGKCGSFSINELLYLLSDNSDCNINWEITLRECYVRKLETIEVLKILGKELIQVISRPKYINNEIVHSLSFQFIYD